MWRSDTRATWPCTTILSMRIWRDARPRIGCAQWGTEKNSSARISPTAPNRPTKLCRVGSTVPGTVKTSWILDSPKWESPMRRSAGLEPSESAMMGAGINTDLPTIANATRHLLRCDRVHLMGHLSNLLQGAAERLCAGDFVASHRVGIRLPGDRIDRTPAVVLGGQGFASTQGAGGIYRERGAAVGQLVYLYLVGQQRPCGRRQSGILHESSGDRVPGIPPAARATAPHAVGGDRAGGERRGVAHLASRASALDRLESGGFFRLLRSAA